MPPKGKKGKGKKKDDNFWENAGESVAPNTLAANPAQVSERIAALGMDDGAEAEEEDFGGLMSTIKAMAKNKKDKKKQKVAEPSVSFEDGPPPGEGSDGEAAAAKGDISAPKAPVQVTAEDLANEEWGPVEEKGRKKSKKGKKDKTTEKLDTEEPEAESPKSLPPPAAKPPKDDDEDAPEGSTVLSKKEKEWMKKEKEKKKAQAAAKKAAAGGEAEVPPSVEPSLPQPQAEAVADKEDADEDADEGGGGGSKDKKKKKKKTSKKEEAPAPTVKKATGALAALKAAVEQKRLMEEEAKRREEEEQWKEKEKAKREVAKKEGRLLTKKQKEEKAAAEIRRKALLESGVKIEGLQTIQGNGVAALKKVVYDNRKKRGPTAVTTKVAFTPTPTEVEKPVPLVEEVVVEPSETSQEEAVSPKDDWEASDEEGKAEDKTEGVKDSWDASSDDETPEPPKPTKEVNGLGAPAKNAAPSSKAPAVAKLADKATLALKPAAPAPSAAAPSAMDESSEEDSDSPDDSNDSSEDDSLESESEGMTATQKQIAQRKAEAAEQRDDLRSPICCILGHVDTGKTKLLDKIQQTNVQEGEARGITQQIGATYFPVDAIKTKTAVMNTDGAFDYKIPGLLIIDTPGHESFTNLRSRGSSLCNIAILVVDIMHGLEPQTLESLRLLRDRKTPFIVALNKIDRMYGWEATPDNSFKASLEKQQSSVKREFEHRLEQTKLAFAEQVPTSAITGEGVPDMIMLLVKLTQERMSDRLMYLSELECTVLEVKVIEGLGTTIDVVLSNGILREGDRIVVCGLNGPIVTNVRALLTPQPLRELRIKSAYVHHKEVKAALGVKLTAPDLEKAIAGSRLLVVGPDDDEDDLRDEVMSDLTSLLSTIDKSGHGVCVQASTLGSLEALLDFLKVSKIPVSGINIGPVHKKDIMRSATMLERAKELACILCFDVTVDKEAEKLAEELGIRLFKADIIYHLFDAFTAYNAEITEAKRKDAAPQAVWPCRLKVIAAFCKRDPIILGVDILDGTLRVGTPICVVKTDPTTSKRETIRLGKISHCYNTSLEINHKSMDIVKKSQAGGGVAVKIEHAVYESAKMFGRHFDDKDELLSQITRQSIDVLKASFKADVSNEEWLLIKSLKQLSASTAWWDPTTGANKGPAPKSVRL
ncbi:hypothetical protein K439DRAFT_1526354 [Ramaria rubella]|nr:hypothetical protein K439DRAFT_1526354 [Ramaria rubella]